MKADIQSEAKSSENERRTLKKECADMKLICSGLEITCTKCKESFKTAGLMRRHKRLGCEKPNRGTNSCEQMQEGSNKQEIENVAQESDFENFTIIIIFRLSEHWPDPGTDQIRKCWSTIG